MSHLPYGVYPPGYERPSYNAVHGPETHTWRVVETGTLAIKVRYRYGSRLGFYIARWRAKTVAARLNKEAQQ